MVKCKDVGGPDWCDEDAEYVRTYRERGGTYVELRCPSGHLSVIPVSEYRDKVRAEEAARRITNADIAHLRIEIESMVFQRLPERQMINEVVLYLESTGRYAALKREELEKTARKLLDLVRKKIEKERLGAVSKYICPDCKKVYLNEKPGADGNLLYYFCTECKKKFSPRDIKRRKVYGKPGWLKRRKAYREKKKELKGTAIKKELEELETLEERRRAGLLTADEHERLLELRGTAAEKREEFKGTLFGAKKEYKTGVSELKEKAKAEKWTRVKYKEEKRKLKEKYIRSKREYKEKVGKEKEKRKAHIGKRVTGFIEDKWGKDVMKAFIVILFAALGFAISGAFGSILFLFGFLSLALYYIFPSPDEETPPRELARQLKENPLTWRMVGSRAFLRNPHTVWGFLKTIFKLSTFILFIFGVWYSPMVPFKNIVLIILCFGAYFSLKMTYNTHMPHQFIESVIRFGLLGAFFIPWVIFYGIFQSGLLALLAMAFFMIPPIAEDKQNTETFAMYEMFDKFIFFGFMLVALIASGVLPLPWFGEVGWKLTGTLQWTFLYFWVVSFVAGFFSPAQTRPAMGFIMLGAATIIYGIGPGAQEFGTALLGPWYPVIQNLFSSIAKPFAEVFGQFANTFGSALMLLVNPVGYAQSIMNGTYARDTTTGLQGAYGIEIERFEVMPIYTESPYVVSVMVKNKGAFEARNVIVALVPSVNVPREEKSWVWGVKEAVLIIPKAAVAVGGWNPLSIEVHMPFLRPNITMTKEGLGFVEEPDTDRGITQKCIDDRRCVFAIGNMTKLQTSQANFYSDGIMCPAVVNYGLMTKEKAKVLPFIGMIQYDYNISSNLEVEAMSKEEWERQVEEMELQPKFKKLTTFTNAPVMLNLDTLEQPILEGSPFHIALNIVSAHKKGRVVGNATVRLEIPTNFTKGKGEENLPPCVPDKIKPKIIKQDDTTTLLEWKGLTEPYAIFCSFPPVKVPEGPTITYMVRADASYTFSKWDTLDTRMQFGGTACCKKSEDCPIPGQICDTSINKCGAGEIDISERLSELEARMNELQNEVDQITEEFADKLIVDINAYDQLLDEMGILKQQYSGDAEVISAIENVETSVNNAIKVACEKCRRWGVDCPSDICSSVGVDL